MPPRGLTGWSLATPALQLLVRQDEEVDWREMLYRRAQMLKLRLPDMTLTTLRDVCWGERPLSMTAELACEALSWRFDGIIGLPEWVADGEHVRRVWMLTRKGEWVWLEVQLDPAEQWKRDDQRRVLSVDVRPATPQEYAEAGYRLDSIWHSTAVTVRGYQDRCHRRAEGADELVAQMATEEAVVVAWRIVQEHLGRQV